MDVMDLENIDADAPIFDPAKAQGTSIRDHLVIGRKGHTSFRSWGCCEDATRFAAWTVDTTRSAASRYD
jgi:hypothetical protein